MATLVQQSQLRKSLAYIDTITPSLANYETTPVNVQDDFNSIRSQLNNFLNRNGAVFPVANWYDDISTPVTLDPGTARGINAQNQALHDLERKRFCFNRSMVGVDVPDPGAAQFVILGAADLPANTTAAVGAVTTVGTVVAFLAAFGAASSTAVVAGANLLQPLNLMVLIDNATGDVVTRPDGRQIFGLLQYESAVDGSTITAVTPNRVQISFVVHNPTNDGLVLITAGDMSGIVFDYTYVERRAFEDLTQEAFLGQGFADSGVSATTRQATYNNQGVAPVVTINSATIDLGTGFFWEIGDALSASLFSILEGSGAGTTNLTIGSDVDVYNNNAIDVNFNNGITADNGSDPINIGIVADQIDFTGNALVTANSGSTMTFGSVAANAILRSLTSGNVLVQSAGDILGTTLSGGATGGEFDVTCGDGTTAGGAIDLNCGNGLVNGNGGPFNANAGVGAGTGNGGDYTCEAGDSGAGATGNGGDWAALAGDALSTNGNGGLIRLNAGARTGTGVFGYVRASSQGSELDPILELLNTSNVVQMFTGTSSPNGTVTAPAGSLYLRDTGAGGEAWVNTSVGTGTVWTQLASAGGATLASVVANVGAASAVMNLPFAWQITDADVLEWQTTTADNLISIAPGAAQDVVTIGNAASLFSSLSLDNNFFEGITVDQGGVPGDGIAIGEVPYEISTSNNNSLSVFASGAGGGGAAGTMNVHGGDHVGGPGAAGVLNLFGGNHTGDASGADANLGGGTSAGTDGSKKGGDVNIFGGDSVTGADGGLVNIDGGSGVDGGQVNITGGTGDTVAGDVNVVAGAASAGSSIAGGFLRLFGGAGDLAGDGGDVLVQAGTAGVTGDGGDALVKAGTGGATSGDGGNTQVAGGDPGALGHGGGVQIKGVNGVGLNRNGGDTILEYGLNTGTGSLGRNSLRTPVSATLTQATQIAELANQGTGAGGGQTVGFYTGTTVPTHTADTGSLFMMDDGSEGRLYQNISAGGSGTTWSLVQNTTTAVSRNFFQDTLVATVSPGGTITAASLTGGVIAVRPLTDFTFNTDAEVFLNGVLLMNGATNDITASGVNNLGVPATGPTFVPGDVLTIVYYTNSTANAV